MSEYVREISHLDPDYLKYEKQCDAVCLNIFGVSTDEMGDADWNFYFTEGYSPIEAIEEAFEYIILNIKIDLHYFEILSKIDFSVEENSFTFSF